MRPIRFALVIALLALPAHAHTLGISKGDYLVRDDTVSANLVFASADFHLLHTPVALEVLGDDAPCLRTETHADEVERDGMNVHVTFRCPKAPQRVRVRANFDDLSQGHEHIANLDVAGSMVIRTLDADAPEIANVAMAVPKKSELSLFEFVWLGIKHILSGWDHLAFLAALALAQSRPRSLALAVTAFTVAHSLTLACAAFGWFVPSSHITEPLIALTVAYVGAENVWMKDWASRRHYVTFGFGLVHGFGFASALHDLDVGRAALPRALFGFNVGVEIGQLGAVLAMLPIAIVLRKRFPKIPAVLGVAICVLGIVWFIDRLRS